MVCPGWNGLEAGGGSRCETCGDPDQGHGLQRPDKGVGHTHPPKEQGRIDEARMPELTADTSPPNGPENGLLEPRSA